MKTVEQCPYLVVLTNYNSLKVNDYKQLLHCHMRTYLYRLIQNCCNWQLPRSQGLFLNQQGL